jgi:fibronectin-binding autotransporter adhesin
LADAGTNSVLGETITGTGPWIKTGQGTLILTAANTYAGGTTNSAGTLQLGNGGMTGSIPGDVTNNGILAFDRSNVLTFEGVISGMGAVQQIGTGTTVLLGDNTCAGGTTINAGTLQLGNGGTTGSITGNITDNGNLAFDRNNALTFGGVISGTGAVQQIGTGTTVLLGDNTYAGGTTINAGTLQLGNGGTTGSITGNVTDNGVLAFNRSNVLSFGGVISGTGAVQKNGTGTTVLLRKNTYTGATTVNAGSLIVDGSIASVQTLVNPGELLGGRGFIGSPGSLNGNLVNSGIVRPGDSPGTLTVNGNYTQTAAGTLRIEVASVTEHGLLAVGGHASLAGTLQLIGLGGFTLHVGDQFTFLTANGGVSGTFGTVQNEILHRDRGASPDRYSAKRRVARRDSGLFRPGRLQSELRSGGPGTGQRGR